MQMVGFQFREPQERGWRFSKVALRQLNLFVGPTGSGKSRLLNTIFNIGKYISSGKGMFAANWAMTLEAAGSVYEWEHESTALKDGRLVVSRERLVQTLESGEVREIISRAPDSFHFEGKRLPKLAADVPSIFMLRDEESVAPLYYHFSHIKRRTFSETGLHEMSAYANVSPEMVKDLERSQSLEQIFAADLPLSGTLYLLRKGFRDRYEDVVRFYRTVFPFIEQCDLVDARLVDASVPIPGNVPVFVVREQGAPGQIALQQLSSGMQKVLLIMADIVSLPDGGTYLIDEYENSLGVNAIDFLPSFLADHAAGRQFILTTHHPYLINNMPVRDWRIFHRKGTQVSIKDGMEYADRFAKSHQAAFVQLINSPFFVKGTE